MHTLHKAACGLALLTGLSLAATSARAQTLTLGQSGSTTLSGTATLTDTGTTTSGTYTYDDGGTGIPLGNQNSFLYGTLTAPASPTSAGSMTYLLINETSTTNVTGGNITGYLETAGSGTANISGGTILQVLTLGDSETNVTGGNTSYFNTYGSEYGGIYGGTLDLYGTGLAETFVEAVTGPGGYTLYNLTGTLQNGDLLNATYYDFGGTLEFNGVEVIPTSPVPEASSMVSFGLLLLLGLGVVAVSRRRRGRAAA